MIKIYVRKIIAGTMLWTEVPNLWQTDVVIELTALGYKCNADGTVEKENIKEVTE